MEYQRHPTLNKILKTIQDGDAQVGGDRLSFKWKPS